MLTGDQTMLPLESFTAFFTWREMCTVRLLFDDALGSDQQESPTPKGKAWGCETIALRT